MSGNVVRPTATRCVNCGKWIRVMAFKGTDWCCERCHKVLVMIGRVRRG